MLLLIRGFSVVAIPALTIVYAASLASIMVLFTRFRERFLVASTLTAFSSLYLAVYSFRSIIYGSYDTIIVVGDPRSITFFALSSNPLSAFFLIGYGIVWFFVSLYSVYYVYTKRLEGFHYWIYFNALYIVMLTFFLVSNPIITIILLDITLILSALLIALEKTSIRARKAAIIYMVSLSIASMFILMGFLVFSNKAGGVYDFKLLGEWWERYHLLDEYTLLASILILVGLSIKMGLVPFHFWLPRAYSEAPTTISSILSSIGVSLGAYELIRIFSEVLEPFWYVTLFLIVTGIASILYGSIYALACHDVKRLVAYSTIAHMGYVAFSLGSSAHLLETGNTFLILGSIAYTATILYVFSHMLAKALLFLIIGGIEASFGLRDLNKLGGLSATMKNTYRLLILVSLQLIGIPPSITYIAKSLIHTATVSSMTQVFFEASIAVIASLLTASYMLKLLVRLSSPRREYHKLLRLIERKYSRLYDKYASILLYGFIGVIIAFSLSTPILVSFISELAKTIGASNIVDYVVVTPVIAYTKLPAPLRLLTVEQELLVVLSTMLIIPSLTLLAYYIWSHLEYISVHMRRIHDRLVHENILLKTSYALRKIQVLVEDLEYNSKVLLVSSLLLLLLLIAALILLG